MVSQKKSVPNKLAMGDHAAMAATAAAELIDHLEQGSMMKVYQAMEDDKMKLILEFSEGEKCVDLLCKLNTMKSQSMRLAMATIMPSTAYICIERSIHKAFRTGTPNIVSRGLQKVMLLFLLMLFPSPGSGYELTKSDQNLCI